MQRGEALRLDSARRNADRCAAMGPAQQRPPSGASSPKVHATFRKPCRRTS